MPNPKRRAPPAADEDPGRAKRASKVTEIIQQEAQGPSRRVLLQRALLLGLVIWCAGALASEIRSRRDGAFSALPHVAAPRQWRLGHPYVEQVRDFARQAAEHIPPGEVVGLLATPRVGPGQRPVLRMWMAYLMPAHDLRLMPRFRKHVIRNLETAEAGSYLVAYRYRPVRIPRLETVWEDPLGGVYRVTPKASP